VCTLTSTECTAAAGAICPAGTCGHLDSAGKPAFHLNPSDSAITSSDTYSLWYRDTNPTNIAGVNGAIGISPIKSSLTLTQTGGALDITACGTTGNPPAVGLSAAEQAGTTDKRFGLTVGGVYEIVLFQAERHTTQSNFHLTLAGFLAPRSSCDTTCGDGVVAG